MVSVRGGFDLNHAMTLIRKSIDAEERKAEKEKDRHAEEELAVKRALQSAEQSRQKYEGWLAAKRKRDFYVSLERGRNFFRPFFLSCLFIFSAFHLSAATLHTYQDLASAILAGERLTIVLNLQECAKNSKLPIGNFSPDAIILVPATDRCEEHISTSHVQFTDYTGHPAYEYTKYTFWPNGAVDIRATLYDSVDFHEEKSHTITCEIDRGVKLIALP